MTSTKQKFDNNSLEYLGKLQLLWCSLTCQYTFILQLHEATKDRFNPRKRCSFNEDDQRQISDLDMQAQEIARLQKELGEKLQLISDMKTQLDSKEDELDYLHGQLAIKEAVDDELPKRVDPQQLLLADGRDADQKGAVPDDKVKVLDNDLAQIREENKKLKNDLHAFDPTSLETLEDLKTANQELTKVSNPKFDSLFHLKFSTSSGYCIKLILETSPSAPVGTGTQYQLRRSYPDY